MHYGPAGWPYGPLFVASHIALQHAHFISVVGDLGFRLHLADARPIAVGLGQRDSTSAVNPAKFASVHPQAWAHTLNRKLEGTIFPRVVRTPRGRR